ncbi:NUDIX domain-containing protein [Tindallia californiensis]|uniref:ADP-ribose pyrophosphatase n=1 Tax=Tindallia californiensis TaxID=159292 RepID=A0A1H3NKF1_9FIRM|nr:NUDIX hydrolase [Tindallia californiensis]SDY89406.1 ADP-ribose pyrophosphatase [Tindallia californiensis]
MEEKTLKSHKIYEGKIISLRIDTVELPDQKYSKREVVEHSGAAAVIPMTKEGNVILVKQYRKPVESCLLEIPAGRLEQDEDPETCAKRELMEETGYWSNHFEKLMVYYTSPGFSNELIHIYLAYDVEEGKSNPDEDEYLEVLSIPFDHLLNKVYAGEVMDSKTIIAVMSSASRILHLRNKQINAE